MAGLFDYEDPESAGRLAFAAGLLNASGPQRMPVSFGQALAQAFMGQQQASTQAAMNRRRNALTDAQIGKLREEANYRKYLMSKGIDPDLPKDIISAQLYMKMTPEEKRQALEWKRGDYEIIDLDGIKQRASRSGLGGGPFPLTSLEREAGAQATLAGAKAGASEYEQSRFRLREGYDPATGRKTWTPEASLNPNVPRFGYGGLQPTPGALTPLPGGMVSRENFPRNPNREDERLRVLQDELAVATDPEWRASLERQIARVRTGGQQAQAPQAAPTPRIEPPGQQEIDEKRRSKISAMQNSISAGKVVASSLDEAYNNVDNLSAGIIGGLTSFIPGTPGYNLEQLILPAEARTALEGLKNMRFESPTGAAMGNIALGEMAILMNSIASMKVGQKPEQLRNGLNKVKQHYESMERTYRAAIKAEEEYLAGGKSQPKPDPLGIR